MTQIKESIANIFAYDQSVLGAHVEIPQLFEKI